MRKKIILMAAVICGLAFALTACGGEAATQKSSQKASSSSSKTETAEAATPDTKGGGYEAKALYRNVFMQFQGAVAENQSVNDVKQSLSVIENITIGNETKTGDKTAELTVTEKDASDPTLTFIFAMDGDNPADGDTCTGIRYAHGDDAVLVTNKDGAPTYYTVTGNTKKKVTEIDRLTKAVAKWQ